MDYTQILTTGVIAAIISSLFGFLSTILTLRAQRKAELRRRATDRHDRIYPKIKAVQDVIKVNKIAEPTTADFEGAQKTWVVLTQTLKTWHTAYVSSEELFDDDIRQRVTNSS